jgi:hypothetical protein
MSLVPAPREKRQHERRILRTNATLLLPGHPGFEVRTADISIGGLGIVAAANPPPGLICRVVLTLPNSSGGARQVEVTGKVAHSVYSSRSGGFQIGMVLLNLDSAATSAIVDYLNCT